jgi:hypothetical protein
MLIIGMGPRKAGEGKSSPAPSMKSGMVKLPVSMFELGEGEENAAPEAGDMVELEGTVESIENGVAMVRVNNAMAEESESEENKPEMSEEDQMMKMAEESDKENYA